MNDYCRECGKTGPSPCVKCANVLKETNARMEHPAKAIIAFVQKLCDAQGIEEIGGEEKPYFSYSRNISWHGEPCFFCKRDKTIHLVRGRYIFAVQGEDGEYIDGSQVYFCGDCNELISPMVNDMFD
jgi:hypothetical protein